MQSDHVNARPKTPMAYTHKQVIVDCHQHNNQPSSQDVCDLRGLALELPPKILDLLDHLLG